MLLHYNGADADINIDTAEPEFCEWTWLSPDRLIDLAVPFKRDVYRHVLTAFTPHIEQAQIISAK
jgi:putative (di)nucleoside polyphosphate hydrolase